MVTEEFVINDSGTVILDFVADGELHTTSISLDDNHLFFSQELSSCYSEKQILIFRYGLKNKENSGTLHFDLRKDLNGNHLNFDCRINGVLMNNEIPSNQEIKILKNFFLHLIGGIPKKLAINISLKKEGTESQKLRKSYELKPI